MHSPGQAGIHPCSWHVPMVRSANTRLLPTRPLPPARALPYRALSVNTSGRALEMAMMNEDLGLLNER